MNAATMQRAVDPVLRIDEGSGLPIYRAGMVPAELGTRRQLRGEGLSVAGLRTAAWLHYSPLHGICRLYLREQARPVRKLTERQQANLAAGRALVGTVVCVRCGSARSVRDAEHCPPCLELVWAERAAAAQRRRDEEHEDFLAMLAEDRSAASRWAAEVLADPNALIIDSETTGLEGSYAVELAAARTDGTIVFERRLNPGVPITAGATAVHGIRDQDVAHCPRFAEVEAEFMALLESASRVIVYNVDFDRSVTRRELVRLQPAPAAPDEPQDSDDEVALREYWQKDDEHHQAIAQLKREVDARLRPLRWECAMHEFARWYGAWHSYWQSYTWQPLGGGHSAAGDCVTVVERLREMAARPIYDPGEPMG